MPSIDQQTKAHRAGSGHGRSIAVAVAIAGVVAIGVVLLVLYGGRGSSTGY